MLHASALAAQVAEVAGDDFNDPLWKDFFSVVNRYRASAKTHQDQALLFAGLNETKGQLKNGR